MPNKIRRANSRQRANGPHSAAPSRRELIAASAATAGALLLPNSAPAEALSPTSYLLSADDAPLPAGVSAVWDRARAHAEKTETRERICLNGLWRWQPVQARADAPPDAHWGWFKAPGSWPGITDYLQKDCQTVFAHDAWRNANMREVSLAWYQREIAIPADWKGRRIALALEYLNTFGTVFVDGKHAGEIRFPAGELDLTDFARPGEKHLLSILVQAAPLKAVMLSYTDTNGAREVKGSVQRRGPCGDVWLSGTPRATRITDVKLTTSVSKAEIGFDIDMENLVLGDAYSILGQIFDNGRLIKEFAPHKFTDADLQAGRLVLTSAWKPDKLWDIHTPQNQYTASVTLRRNGQVVDRALPVRFGFREFAIKGRDFYLNGKRIYLPTLPLHNAEVGAAWASYAGARETLERLKGLGIYFLYTGNYSCLPGDHLGFSEMLRAADDVGMLIAFTQPHFSNYDWKATDSDNKNGYATHAAWYVRVAQNHPSVVAYAMSHNACGYVEMDNPDMMDGIQGKQGGNAQLALRAQAIVERFDTSRIIYHHSSGNFGPMHSCNFYVNLVPVQELSDWFEYWETHSVKPLYLCEYGCPYSWDWTMYRGWYKGNREWGSANVPWEFCVAEWDAPYVGDTAYKINEREKANIRWEADHFRKGDVWHRWDYPTFVGAPDFPDVNTVYAQYITDNWRAFRTRGVSAFGPFEYGMFWKLSNSADRSRKAVKVDWANLQKPGFSADYIEEQPPDYALAYDRSEWLPTPAGQAVLRNNMPLLAYIGGSQGDVTSKHHIYFPGETIEKQLVIINNARTSVKAECRWNAALPAAPAEARTITLEVGDKALVPISVKLPNELPAGDYPIEASVRFNGGEVQKDMFSFHVRPPHAALKVTGTIALYDPHGDTTKQLTGLKFNTVNPGDDLAGVDVLIIGKAALSVDGAGPDLARVRDGLKVVVLEQSAEVLEQRFGFRTAAYGMRQVFRRIPDHPLLAGLDEEQLRDWRGSATTLPPRLKYTIGERYAPQVKWCGMDITRAWRVGCRGSVASVVIEKPASGDFLPIVDCGYGLQYAAVMEYREGKGMVLFCQLDVSGRTQQEPAAEHLLRNVLTYASKWTPSPQREVIYIGEEPGLAHFTAAGFAPRRPIDAGLPQGALLVAGPDCGREAAGRHIDAWLKAGGRLLAIGLDGAQARDLTSIPVETTQAEHIAAHFERPAASSWLAGVCPADIHNRDPRKFALVTGGAEAVGDGVLAHSGGSVTLCQLAPWEFKHTPMNQKRTFRHVAFLNSRLACNLGAHSSTKLLNYFAAPPGPNDKRWLEGLYLDVPEEWDDPYRFFGW